MVTLQSYNGRDLAGFIFMNKKPSSLKLRPSARYLGVLVKGAKQAGLDPGYIEKLSKQPTYQPNETVLKARRERPKPEKLKEITVEELSKKSKVDILSWLCFGTS